MIGKAPSNFRGHAADAQRTVEICTEQSQQHLGLVWLLMSRGGTSCHEGLWAPSKCSQGTLGFSSENVTSRTRAAKEKTQPSDSNQAILKPPPTATPQDRRFQRHQRCFSSSVVIWAEGPSGEGSPCSPPPRNTTKSHICTKILKCQKQRISVGTETAIFFNSRSC